MWFDENTVPGWTTRTGGQCCTRRVVVRCNPLVDEITVALAEPGAVLTMLGDYLRVEMLPEVELPHETFATVTLVSGA